MVIYWLPVLCLTLFSKSFQSYRGGQCSYWWFLRPVLCIRTIYFPGFWWPCRITIVGKIIHGIGRTNPCAITHKPSIRCWPGRGSKQRGPDHPYVLKSCASRNGLQVAEISFQPELLGYACFRQNSKIRNYLRCFFFNVFDRPLDNYLIETSGKALDFLMIVQLTVKQAYFSLHFKFKKKQVMVSVDNIHPWTVFNMPKYRTR